MLSSNRRAAEAVFLLQYDFVFRVTFFGGRELDGRGCGGVADVERDWLLRIVREIDDAGLSVGIGTDLEFGLVQTEGAKFNERVDAGIVDRFGVGAGNVEIGRAVSEISRELWSVGGEGSGRDEHEGKQETTHELMVAANSEMHRCFAGLEPSSA